MSQPSTHHLFKTVPFAQSRRALRKAWVAIALGAVCGLASVTVNAKPMSESAIQSRTVRSDEAGVVLQTRRGDSLRTIAQYYSVKNNIPFKQALEVLTQTNQAQFPGGDPDRMQVGAQIVLPKQGTAASESSKPEPTVAASSANETTAASSAGVAADATQAAIVHAVPVAPTPSASPPQTEPTVSTQVATTAAQGGMAQLKAWFLCVPKSLWLVIIPALLLSAFVWLMMRGSRQGKDDAATDDLTVNDVTEKVAPSTVAPVQAEQVAQTENQTPAAASTNTMPASSVTSTAPSDSGTSGLNVNHLLRQYANHTAEKSGQAVNYYALAERTRLQKWMSAQSIDDLLDHAQKAYAQAYPNVAHHILNEVILRGNAAQSTQALDLRNQWHIQYLRQQAQESRGH